VTVKDLTGDISQVFPCFDFQTIADSLHSASLTWKYYAPGQGDKGYKWSAFDAISHIRNTSSMDDKRRRNIPVCDRCSKRPATFC
jgi:hypothetical protein